MSEKVYIIAEAGVNHNGDMKVAEGMIRAAADAGADAVKFQSFKAENLAARHAPKAHYQMQTTSKQQSQYEMLKSLELTEQNHTELIKQCRMCKISFLSTSFACQEAVFLKSLGLDTFKIPSGEITNLPLLRLIGSFGKKIILSTGMADIDEVRAALDILVSAGTAPDKIIVLQCTTAYPACHRDVNLRAMITMRDKLNVKVGYSDHTKGIEVAVAAAALGACVIEKHFTLDRSMQGPDHRASIEPAELKEMVRCIRNVEKALGDGVKKPSAAELTNRPVARKSIVAAADIKKGSKFTIENITVKRPGSGVNPMMWDKLIGKQAIKDFRKDDLIIL